MPTTFPSGLVVWNCTPHDFVFWCHLGGGEGVEIVAPSDGILNAIPHNRFVIEDEKYKIVSVTYHPTDEGRRMVRKMKREIPDSLIVGSMIAAQAYAGDVVATVPYRSSRNTDSRLVKGDRFTTFKENQSGEENSRIRAD